MQQTLGLFGPEIGGVGFRYVAGAVVARWCLGG